MKAAAYIPIIVLGVGMPAAIGYYVGQKGADPSPTNQDNEPQVQVSHDPKIMNDPRTENLEAPKAETPKVRIISPESLAKEKNVPAALKNPQGDFTLVAVIESVAANAKLNRSIQLVTAQRRRLGSLTQQYKKLPEDAVKKRELIAGQINETRNALKQNLGYMQKKYGYSLKNNYAYIPHKASLHAVTEADGKPKSELVCDFPSKKSYQDFQSKREGYLRLKIEQVKAAQTAAAEDKNPKSTDPKASKPLKLEPTEEMKEKVAELVDLYNYDPDKNYRIDTEKAVLYARPVGK